MGRRPVERRWESQCCPVPTATAGEENGSKKGELPFAVTDRVLECSRTVVVSLSEH